MVQITDLESAEAWLGVQPREVQVAFAARCALRVLPAIGVTSSETFHGVAFGAIRATLTSCVAALVQVDEAGTLFAANADAAASDAAAADAAAAAAAAAADAANAAAFAANAAAAAADAANAAYADAAAAAAADNAAKAAYAAVHSADANAAFAAVFAAASSDASWIEENRGDVAIVFSRPVWPDGIPESFVPVAESLQARWEVAPQLGPFWKNWFEGMSSGAPVDWELQKTIALIANETWEAGPERVAEEIRMIEANAGSRKIYLTDTFDRDATPPSLSDADLDELLSALPPAKTVPDPIATSDDLAFSLLSEKGKAMHRRIFDDPFEDLFKGESDATPDPLLPEIEGGVGETGSLPDVFVFLSYAREDQARVGEIRAFLMAQGIRLWWDQEIPVGANWHRELERQLDAATFVLALWSETSRDSDAVYDEAMRAKEDGKLLHARLDDIKIPLGFGRTQRVDLWDWEGTEEHPGMARLIQSIREALTRGD